LTGFFHFIFYLIFLVSCSTFTVFLEPQHPILGSYNIVNSEQYRWKVKEEKKKTHKY